MSLKIKPLKSGRDSITEPPLAENYTIPGVGSTIFCGTTGSGKTVAMTNLLKEKHMLGGFFDYIYVFCLSPCTLLQDHLKIPDERIVLDGDPKKLQLIIDQQKKLVKKNFKKAPNILIVLDDMISCHKFMASRALREIYFGGTHFKMSNFLCVQSWVKLPRSLRINAHHILLFHGVNDGEVERFATEHRPGGVKKQEFINLVNFAVSEPYGFLFANCRIPDKTQKFRKNFDTILKLG